MDITLTYRGPLLACQPNNPRSEEKQQLRLAFSPQLEQKWKDSSVLSEAWRDRGVLVARLVNQKPEVLSMDAGGKAHYWVGVGGYAAVPLVTRQNGLICELDIDLLRAEEPGSILNGGDLDNRLKTLLDGLRIPLSDREVPGHLMGRHQSHWLYCLLEDDHLVSKLNVTAHQIYVDPATQDRQSYAELVIKASVKVLKPHKLTTGY